MNTAEFTDLVSSLIPRSSQNSHVKAARQLLHIMTLIYCFGAIELHKVRYADGKLFIKSLIRSKSLIFKLAAALGVVIPMPVPGSNEAPEKLLDLARHHRIPLEAFQGPNVTPYDVYYDLNVVVTFMEVVFKLMGRLKTNDLQKLERGYRGHCHPDYSKPQRTFRSLFSKADPGTHLLGLAASDMPGAQARTEIAEEPAKFPVHPRLRPRPRPLPRPHADYHTSALKTANLGTLPPPKLGASSRASGPIRRRTGTH